MPGDLAARPRSLPEVHRSIPVPGLSVQGAAWRRLLVFVGPGYLVAVGYMDPGNWATSLAGGSQFGYTLLSVVLVSNLMAMLFQAAAVRLGIGAGIDLAQACRRHFSPGISFLLWVLCEIAIVACNLAEVIGMAIGLNLLFGLPLVAGVIVTVLDVLLFLRASKPRLSMARGRHHCPGRDGWRLLRASMVWLQPALAAVLAGFVPQPRIVTRPCDALSRRRHHGRDGDAAQPLPAFVACANPSPRGSMRGKREAIRFGTIDSTLALGLALLVNAAIWSWPAATSTAPDVEPVSELSEAYELLSPLLGVGIASALFDVALICSGLSSSVDRDPRRRDRHGRLSRHPGFSRGAGAC